MKVFWLVFLFTICLRFLRSHSLVDVIRIRYGDRPLKNLGKSERLDYQIRKCQLDIEFLNTCFKYNAIPNFLWFGVTNKTLKDSLTYSRPQQLLLVRKFDVRSDAYGNCLNMIVSNRNCSINFHLLILCMCHDCF